MSQTAVGEKVSVIRAAQIALSYLTQLIPSVAPADASLEEVEMAGDEWLITLGYTDPKASEVQRQFTDSRIYKQFRINAYTGEVLAMLIRKP